MSNDELHVYWASPHIEWTETTVNNILKTHKSRRYEETNWKKRVAQTTSYVILPNLAHTLLVITVTFFLASIELFVSLSFRLSRVFRFRFSTIHVIALELKFLYFFYTCEKSSTANPLLQSQTDDSDVKMRRVARLQEKNHIQEISDRIKSTVPINEKQNKLPIM